MPGDEELGFEAAVAALGESVCLEPMCELSLAQVLKGVETWALCGKGKASRAYKTVKNLGQKRVL